MSECVGNHVEKMESEWAAGAHAACVDALFLHTLHAQTLTEAYAE